MRALVAACLLGFACLGQSQPLPIFDAHLHYSHDAWDLVPVEDVIALLRKAGVRRALVSSSGVSLPGLRNVAQTAPYMHNGSLATLRDVVRHYSELNEERLHADGERILRPLRLSEDDISDLVEFLETL